MKWEGALGDDVAITSLVPSSKSLSNSSLVPFSTVKTNTLHPFEFSVRVCTTRQLRRRFLTRRSLLKSMTLLTTSPQPWSTNSIANMVVPIPGRLGRDANSLQVTSWPRRKRTLKVVVPLSPLWTPFPPNVEHSSQDDLPTHSHRLPRPLCNG